MVSSFFKDKRVAVLATLAFTAFSGPGGLYALYLRDFGPITDYTSWIRIIWQTGEKFLLEGWYPPFAIGFVPSDIAYACLWWMVYATHRLELQNRFNFILMSIVLALSYLLHGVDLVIFIIYLGALLLVHLCTQNQEGKKRVRWVAFSVIAALALVAAIEVSLTKYYYFAQYTRTLYDFPRYFYFNTSHFYVAVATSTIIITLTYAKPAAQNFMSKLISWMTKPIILMVCFLYVLSLAIWVRALPSFNSGLIGVGPVPWYAYSATGGIPFFLALIGATYLALNWKRLKNNVRDALVFSVLSMALLFIFGRIVSLVNLNFFYTGFWERRILVYMRPMISILAAYALVIVFTRINVKKPFDWLKFIMTSFLISLVILSSVSTALIALDFTAREGVSAPTKEELEALTYLRYSLPKGFKTAYLNRYTGIYFIRGFANDKWTFDPKLWIGHFPYSPETILYVIGEGNLRLLYLHHTRDIRDLQKNLFLQQLLNMLPVEFNNSDVTIYSVPPLHPPLSFSSLGVIPPDETYGASYDAYILWLLTLAVSNYSYTISDFSDPTIFVGSQVFILPYDPPPFGDDVAKLLEWVTNGGHLIVSNTNAYGTFAELFGLTSKVSLVSCDSTDNWKTSYDRGEILFETAEKIEGASSLRMRNNSSAWEEWVYTTQEPWDLSEYEYLGIWVYGTGGGPKWYLHLFDSNGRRSFPSYRYDLSRWDSEKQTYVPNFSGWKLHLIPIKEYFSDIDLSNIKELRVVTGFEMPVDMIIDDIFALRGYPYVTANGIGSKETINLPIVMVQNISFSAEVRVVANYTKDGTPVAAFAIQKDLGEGRVTYLNINLLYESILSEGAEPVSTEMFVKILEMIDIKVPP